MRRLFAALIMLLFVAACSPVTVEETLEPLTAPTDLPATETVSPTPPPTVIPEPTSSPTQVPSATPIPTPISGQFVCGKSSGEPPTLVYDATQNVGMPGEILFPQIAAWLQTTGSTKGLEAALEASAESPVVTAEIRTLDLTGDDIEEDLLVINFAYGPGFQELLTLISTSCDAGNFTISHPTFHSFFGGSGTGTIIEDIADFNSNGVPDILLRRNTIRGMKGAQVIGIQEWDGTQLAEYFHIESGYGDFGNILWADRDGDPETTELTISFFYAYEQETAGGTIEYNLYRDIDMVYRWNGDEFELACQYFSDDPATIVYDYLPDTHSLMVLHSAETLRACRLYDEATPHYQELFNMELGNAYLRAFAGYRLMQIAIHQGNPESVEAILTTLQEAYPSGQQGFQYVAMAAALWENFQSTQNLTQACDAAAQAFEAARGTTDPGIEYNDSVYPDGSVSHLGYYLANGHRYGADPDNLFDVPDDIDSMVSTPICLQ